MRRVSVSLVLAGLALGVVGCGAAASGIGRAAAGAGARTGARAATVTVPKVAVKAGGHSGGFGGPLLQEAGQQALRHGIGGDDRKTR